ncbi:MAG TPA: helix-turn-helix transcriptional regulator [Brevundimonas sp.]|uniref:helix-turn-helix domain-containing protein n=1 Tax=Brevundimonas sp. TaxID=1871086 RepID=UPI002638DBCB|nr:helix-turn-helix transcriptional regulator [Brevundimonas sp.]HRO33916.1 helix-turn-helix transcriptional regulator [Brevundimonas sp.]
MRARELLAWNLRRLRSDRGQSQERLAADTGIDRAYLSELERGQGNATLDIIDRLAAHLGVEPVEFLAPQDPSSPMPENLKPGRKART